ncbi:MAG: DUF4352 domain-containing protein [Chloroflexi bacterium]|nr:DUF4352 domain-containing protein [Chloroflexota bacterium]
MSYQDDYRYRNVFAPEPEPSRPKPGIWLLAIGAFICICVCIGLVAGVLWARAQSGGLPALPLLTSATPTRDPSAPVALRTPAIGTGGVEVTATIFQRPLKVEGAPKIPETDQFVLVTIRIRNTRTTGAAVKVTAADFEMIGDGGLKYAPNPKNVTIKDLLKEADVAPGKDVTVELIFQIASNDSGLKLNWTSGSAKRTIILEK